MKKKKSPLPQEKSNDRQAARRERRREKEEKTNFLRRVKNAPDGRAPFTERTKSYYRFAKHYPHDISADGYRKNEKQIPEGRTKKILICCCLCTIAFVLGIFLTKTAIELSKINPDEATQETDRNPDIFAVKLNTDEWSDETADSLIQGWTEQGVNCIIIEIKKQNGLVPFNPEGEALAEILTKLHDGGLYTAAYISCFKDNSRTSAYPAQAVLSESSVGGVLYNSDGFAYLNVFSSDAVEYVTGIVEETAAADFDYIILDEITLPVDTGSATPYYSGYSGAKGEMNSRLLSVAMSLISTAGTDKAILATDVYGYYETDAVTGTRYEGAISLPESIARAVDVRVSLQNENGKDPLEIMQYLTSVPDVFVLEACSFAKKSCSENTPVFALCDSEEDAENIRAAGINNIFVMN